MRTATDWKRHPFVAELRKRDLVTYNCLCRLQKCGCDPLSLVSTLSLLEPNGLHLLSSWREDFDRMKAKDLRRSASEIEWVAKKIRRFNNTRGVWTVLGALSPQSPLQDLPTLLNRYATTLKVLISLVGPKKHLAVSCQRGILVRTVQNATGRYHDEEISRLIAYAEKRRKYSCRAHIRWRRDNSELIRSLTV